jgi:ionotropic glutamate receptor
LLFQAFGWREAVPIYIDNGYGEGIIPYLTDALQAVGARITYRISVISSSATNDQIVEELYKLMTMQTSSLSTICILLLALGFLPKRKRLEW